MKTTHILGMAKSSLDLRGAKSAKLELDYLRLLYAVEKIKAMGDDAQGYLMVLSETVADTVRANWMTKYGDNPAVQIVSAKPEKKGLKRLLAEKAALAGALLLKKRVNQAEKALSVAKVGKELGEEALRAHIVNLHPGVVPSEFHPLSMEWDFCGVLSPAGEVAPVSEAIL